MKTPVLPALAPVGHLLLRVALVCCLMGAVAAVHAVNYTSNGSGSWDKPTTWQPPGKPGPGDNVTIRGGDEVKIDAGTTKVGSLTVNGTLAGGYGSSTSTTIKIVADGDVTVGSGGSIRTIDRNPPIVGSSDPSDLSKKTPTGSITIDCANLTNEGTIQSGKSNIRGAGTGSVTISARGNVTNSGYTSKIASGDDDAAATRKKQPLKQGAPTGSVTITAGGQATNDGQIRSGNATTNGANSGAVSVSGKTGVANNGAVCSGQGADGDVDNAKSSRQNGGKSGEVSVTSSGGSVANNHGGTIFSGNGGTGSSCGASGSCGNGGASGEVKVRGKNGVTNSGDIASGDGGHGGEDTPERPGHGGDGGNSGTVKVSGPRIEGTAGSGVRVKSGNGGNGGDSRNAPDKKGGNGGASGGVVVGGYSKDTKAGEVRGAGQVWTGARGEGGTALVPANDGAAGARGKAEIHAAALFLQQAGGVEAGDCAIGFGPGPLDLTGAPAGRIMGGTGVAIRGGGPIQLQGIPPGTNAIVCVSGPITFHVQDPAQIQLDPGVTLADITEPDAAVVVEPVLAPAELEAAPLGRSQVFLTWWDLAANDAGYRIERQEVGGVWIPIGMTGPGAPPVFVDSGLVAGATRTYRVAAIAGPPEACTNEATATTASDYAQWMTGNDVPGDSDDGDGDGLCALGEYTLGFDPTFADAFPWIAFQMTCQQPDQLVSLVYFRPDGRDDCVVVIDGTPTGDLGLWGAAAVEPETIGGPVIHEIECAGMDRYFTRLRFRSADPGLAPRNIQVRHAEITRTSIPLEWEAGVMPAIEYRVQRSLDGEGFETIGVVPFVPGLIQFTDTTCAEGTQYLYVIQAIGAANAAPCSAAVTARTLD